MDYSAQLNDLYELLVAALVAGTTFGVLVLVALGILVVKALW